MDLPAGKNLNDPTFRKSGYMRYCIVHNHAAEILHDLYIVNCYFPPQYLDLLFDFTKKKKKDK